jgi:ATP-binding cassette, subfamily C, bacterial
MWQNFKIFFNTEGTRPWAVLLCLLFGGLAEALGIGTLLPIASTMLETTGGPSNPFEAFIHQALATFGISPTLGNMIVVILSIMTLRSLLLFAAMSYAGITAARVSVMFRRRIIKAVFDARWSFYANQSAGHLATTLGNDATRAGEAYLIIASVTACLVQIVAYAIVAAFINWQVAFFGLLCGLLIAVLSSKLVKISRSSGNKMASRISTISADVLDMLNNIKALKAMHRYMPLLGHLDLVLNRLTKSLNAMSLSRYGLMYANDWLVAVFAGLGAYAAHVWAGIPLQQLFVIGILFFQVVNYASKLQRQVQTAALFQGSYDRVVKVLADANAAREELAGQQAAQIGSGIHFNTVSFAHGERTILDGLSLDIPAQQITVLQGASGAGKTTTLDLISGFLRPQSGQIRIGADDLATIDLRAWRGKIGYVPQELALFHDSVIANVTLYDESLPQTQIAESLELSGVADFLHQLPNGAETDVGEFGGKLSGGQRQRISLARALVSQPQLLILDEVTSALDPDTEAAIVNNIAKLRGRYTIIAITHRPAWTHIADRLYTLKDGKAHLQKTLKDKRK